MSPLGIASTLFSLVSSVGSSATESKSKSSVSANGLDFSSSLALRMASMQSQSMDSLVATVFDGKKSGGLDFLASGMSGNKFSEQLSSLGRNMSLFDPESAYRMMSNINTRDATYKAQFSELSEMKTALAGMQQAGDSLGALNGASDNAAIQSQLQAFATQYNAWVSRFDNTVQKGGLLAGTQAAEVSLYELRQSVENRVNGAMHGVKGMSDLGFSIDPKTHLASLDLGKLEAMLTKNRDGAVSAISEFSGNFAKSAELLISSNNFVPNRLANLDRVIDYIADNKSSLQAEFGLGDPARMSPQVSKALAAYEQMFKV